MRLLLSAHPVALIMSYRVMALVEHGHYQPRNPGFLKLHPGYLLLGDELTYSLFNRIETEIDDLLLPYTVDLSLYSHIDNADLLDHIQRMGKLFYQRESG